MSTHTPTKERLERARYFAHAKAGAKRNLTGPDLETAEELWWPRLGTKYVQAGYHKTRAEALNAARAFRQKCRDYLTEHGEPTS